jgi:hypothetical protein
MTAKDQSLDIIGQRLRAQGAEMTREPLPKRWVELIHCLDERERLAGTDAESAVSRQEELLTELVSIGEPTEKARTLLEDLRRRVARALNERT